MASPTVVARRITRAMRIAGCTASGLDRPSRLDQKRSDPTENSRPSQNRAAVCPLARHAVTRFVHAARSAIHVRLHARRHARKTGSVQRIPTWMFNPGTCASMSIGAPRASVRALVEVRTILTEVGFHASRTAVERRGEEKVDAVSVISVSRVRSVKTAAA